MKITTRLLPVALVAALLGLSAIASAQMNYQGRLTGPTGTARDAGPTKLTFSIYNAAGTKIWGDYVMDGVAENGHGPKADLIADGRFNVIIGATDTTSRTMTSAIAAAGTGAIFLEIKVENEAAISPRQQILATPRALFADTIPNVTPTAAGNIGIGTTPDSKLHVNGSGAAPALKVAVNGSSKMVVNQNGGVSVGTGNTPPASGLLVAGSAEFSAVTADTVTATTLNGEKPPMVYKVGNVFNSTNFYETVIPREIVETYLGDENGGTIRINLRLNNSAEDYVRTIEEKIYFEQRGDRENGTGVYGATIQTGGNNSAYVLGNGTKYSLIPFPFSAIHLRNYHSGGGAGLPLSADGPAFTGADLYKLVFLTERNWSATIIIYDR